ncbi:LOB domain-containing protein 1 [Ricinus communis]|uniref:LOB domain-containing protein, putative n=1 Tax=Ricinus communis TaxID=3988 RepID=B9SK21_RICCO|nr:LOB domain-containing protein 1 [Ricinus communis]EEF36011.1 LOB domain-containing protein, putative [Ricinus communis]|eukprot:XP_002526340.1 LOB domain-containing protein 1 [Ricinus communis]
MDCSEAIATISANSSSPSLSNSPTSSSSPPLTPAPVILSPCAACKILRRRCADKCVLAPYFPPTEPAKFTIAHRVFGASNIIKFLQELPESQRADAVSSMVYEASARIRDPVYGCAGAICQLQKQVNELQAQLAKAQAEVVNMQCQQANLMALIYMEMAQSPQQSSEQSIDDFITTPQSYQSNPCFLDESNLGTMWEPLWT